jgi:hypothetical protein
MAKLTCEAVHAVLRDVVFKGDELQDGLIPENGVIVDGLITAYAFHPERVAAAKPQIDALLAELPGGFQQGQGGGWTFLNACDDKDGVHWGEHRDMEVLICLGIAVGSASWMLKEMCEALPGGVPYVEVHPA